MVSDLGNLSHLQAHEEIKETHVDVHFIERQVLQRYVCNN